MGADPPLLRQRARRPHRRQALRHRNPGAVLRRRFALHPSADPAQPAHRRDLPHRHALCRAADARRLPQARRDQGRAFHQRARGLRGHPQRRGRGVLDHGAVDHHRREAGTAEGHRDALCRLRDRLRRPRRGDLGENRARAHAGGAPDQCRQAQVSPSPHRSAAAAVPFRDHARRFPSAAAALRRSGALFARGVRADARMAGRLGPGQERRRFRRPREEQDSERGGLKPLQYAEYPRADP